MTIPLVATPSPLHPIRDRDGNRCPAATAASYPLFGRCRCQEQITAVDGTADWVHVATRQIQCA